MKQNHQPPNDTVDEMVIAHYCTQYPLINQESHCTASFGSWWFCFILLRFAGKMARIEQTPRKGDKQKVKGKPHADREPSKWGDAGHVTFHRPLPFHQGIGLATHCIKVCTVLCVELHVLVKISLWNVIHYSKL